jgi:hypothetical protein
MVRFHLYIRWFLASFVAWCAVIEPAFDRWQWRPVASGEVTQTGSFAFRGAIPGVASTPPGETHWSSWAGNDQNVGEWATGVFPAPHRLRLGVRGYPNLPGNHLRLELVSTGAFLPLASHNPGESWEQMDVTVPRAWRGSGLRVVAQDGAVDWGGWLAVRQIEAARIPLPQLPPVLHRLGRLLAVAALLVMLAQAAHRGVGQRLRLPEHLAGPVALGGVAIASFTVWGAYLVGPWCGRTLAWTMLVLAWVTALFPRPPDADEIPPRVDVWVPVLLALLAAGLYLSALLLVAPAAPIEQLAAGRFLHNLPADNTLPHYFADLLRRGEDPRVGFGDWLSSDRPPLQTGWVLLLAAPLAEAGWEFVDLAQMAGLLFQLVWIPAGWAWLRHHGVGPARTTLVLLAMVPTAVLAINSLYVWPKLGGAAWMLLASVFWLARPGPTAVAAAAGGLAAGLAWLSHGGVAFAGLALAPLLAWRWRRCGLRPWVAAGAGFLALALPWKAYQSFYDPPGSRLLKWHLAGVIAPDARGVGETLRTAYRETPGSRLAEVRWINVRTWFAGDWRARLSPIKRSLTVRTHEATFLAYSLGLWPLGWVVGWFWRRPRAHERSRLDSVETGALCWAAVAVVVWTLLLFLPEAARNHQGTYLVQLLVFLGTGSRMVRVAPAYFLSPPACELGELCAPVADRSCAALATALGWPGSGGAVGDVCCPGLGGSAGMETARGRHASIGGRAGRGKLLLPEPGLGHARGSKGTGPVECLTEALQGLARRVAEQ